MFTESHSSRSRRKHWLYCPRQCAFIHLEQVWAENKFTAEGQVLHKKAHEGPDENRDGVRITRSLPVRSFLLGISGQCDVVKVPSDGPVLPVEYKRGKPKTHRADEVQLCAQGMCLEEMLDRGHGRFSLLRGRHGAASVHFLIRRSGVLSSRPQVRYMR